MIDYFFIVGEEIKNICEIYINISARTKWYAGYALLPGLYVSEFDCHPVYEYTLYRSTFSISVPINLFISLYHKGIPYRNLS